MPEATTCTVTLRKKEIIGLLRGAAKNEIRYYLNGICLDFDRGVCVTTNGHLLLCMKPEIMTGKGKPIVNRQTLERAITLCGKRRGMNEDITIAVTVPDVSVTVEGSTLTEKVIDGTFPEYERVIPRKLSGKPACINAQYVALMALALDEIADREGYPQIAHNGPENACVMASQMAENAFAVIMPLRAWGDVTATAMHRVGNLFPLPKKRAKKKAAKKASKKAAPKKAKRKSSKRKAA